MNFLRFEMDLVPIRLSSISYVEVKCHSLCQLHKTRCGLSLFQMDLSTIEDFRHLMLISQTNWQLHFNRGWFRLMVFNATFNNMSVISWQSVLLVEETGVPRENHRPVLSHWQTSSHNVVSSTPRLNAIRTHNVSGRRHWLHRLL
jgi:hypothetical protein